MLLDWRLPDEIGPSVCRRLDEAVPRPAIVMLTGLDDPRERDAARQAGADDFLVKGIDPDALAERLRGLVGGARFSRTAAPADGASARAEGRGAPASASRNWIASLSAHWPLPRFGRGASVLSAARLAACAAWPGRARPRG